MHAQSLIVDVSMYSEVTFDLKVRFDSPAACEEIDDFREGVELSFRSLTEEGHGEWIPLMYIANLSRTTQPFVELPSENIAGDSNSGDFTLRGYNVPYVIQNGDYYTYNISICGNDIFQHQLQFRWLHSSYQVGDFIRDVVLLDNITVSVQNSTHYTVLLQDCFDGQNSIK